MISKEQMQEITNQLEQGVRKIFEGQQYLEYLKLSDRFHNYSFRNTVLIFTQNPNATRVAGFNTWKNSFGRSVKKGEKGIRIFAPAPYKQTVTITNDQNGNPLKNEQENLPPQRKEITIPAFKPVYVFDVSQTEGRELPALGAGELTGNVERYETFWEALKQASPVPLAFEDLDRDTDGYYHLGEKRIAIRSGMSEIQTVAAAIHEITHATLHDIDLNHLNTVDKEKRKDARTREVEAESVAYTVCQHYGIETADNSFGYVAGWSSNKNLAELQSSLETIQKTAAKLIDEIDAQFALLCTKEQELPVIPSPIYQLIDEYERPGTPEFHTVFGYEEKDILVNYALHQANFDEVALVAADMAEARYELKTGFADPEIKQRLDLFNEKIDKLMEKSMLTSQSPELIRLDAPFVPPIEIINYDPNTAGTDRFRYQVEEKENGAVYLIDGDEADIFAINTIDLDTGERTIIGFNSLREYTFEADSYRQCLFENDEIYAGVKNLHFESHEGLWEVLAKTSVSSHNYYIISKMNVEIPQNMIVNETGAVIYESAFADNPKWDHSDFIRLASHLAAEGIIEQNNHVQSEHIPVSRQQSKVVKELHEGCATRIRVGRPAGLVNSPSKTSIGDRLADAKTTLEKAEHKPTQRVKITEMEK